MKKINIDNRDYHYHRKGIGYNDYNFCENVIPRISTWLLSEFNELLYKSFDEQDKLAEKLKKIAAIIDEEE